MTGRACIWNRVPLRHFRRDEAEGMGVDKRPGNAFSFDRGHVAGDTLAPGAALFVMGVLFEGRLARAVGA